MKQKTYYYLIHFDLCVDKGIETEIVGRIWGYNEYEEELPALKVLLLGYYRKKRPEATSIQIFFTEVKMVDKRAYEREIKKWEAFELT